MTDTPGPPETARAANVSTLLPAQLLAVLDDYCQANRMTRGEAVAALVAQSLVPWAVADRAQQAAEREAPER